MAECGPLSYPGSMNLNGDDIAAFYPHVSHSQLNNAQGLSGRHPRPRVPEYGWSMYSDDPSATSQRYSACNGLGIEGPLRGRLYRTSSQIADGGNAFATTTQVTDPLPTSTKSRTRDLDMHTSTKQDGSRSSGRGDFSTYCSELSDEGPQHDCSRPYNNALVSIPKTRTLPAHPLGTAAPAVCVTPEPAVAEKSQDHVLPGTAAEHAGTPDNSTAYSRSNTSTLAPNTPSGASHDLSDHSPGSSTTLPHADGDTSKRHIAAGPCNFLWELPKPPAKRRRRDVRDAGLDEGSAGTIMRKKRRPRGPFTNIEAREQTALTRNIKACIRCRMQKVRCHPDPDDPAGPCLDCRRSASKLILTLPCVRSMITDALLYRDQERPLEFFSKRWSSMEDVAITEWASPEIVTVEISHIFRHFPYRAELRRFIPRDPGEVTSEPWTDAQGVLRTQYMPPYAIADVDKHAEVLRSWIDSSISQYILGLVDQTNDLLWETYLAAFKHVYNAREERERSLMRNAFRLWATCCCCCHQTRLVGPETLGIAEVTDPASPWFGQRPDPPLMTPQEECIYYNKLLRPYSKQVLNDLQMLCLSNNKRHWWTIYLAIFILLHSCSIMTRRDAEFAAQMSMPVLFSIPALQQLLADTPSQTEYANPDSIRALQAGATTLLAHFHHVNKGSTPFTTALKAGGLRDIRRATDMDNESMDLLRRTAERVDKQKPKMAAIRARRLFGDDLFWLSQLYQGDWSPSATV